MQTSSLGGAAVPVNYSAPVVSGGTGQVNVTCNPATGALFPAGATPVTCAAQDASGRQASCTFGVNVSAVPRLAKTRFLAFGDSLTEGKLSLSLTLLIDSPAHSYPAQLLRRLTERYTGQEITLINEGFGGELAAESLNRLNGALSTHRPEAMLLMHGVNDLNGTSDGLIQITVDALEELTKAAQQRGATAFVATLPPLGPGGKAGCPECVEPLNERIESMAAAKRAVLVDVHAAWGTGSGLMGPDGIHPTAAGYEVIAGAFFEAIRRTLEGTGSIQ